MNSVKAYLFDFDGTLVDTMDQYGEIAGMLISRYHPELAKEEAKRRYLQTSGIPFFRQLEILYPEHPDNNAIASIYEAEKNEELMKNKFSEEVRETIADLKKKSRVIISSNNFQEIIDRFVQKEGVEFDLALGYREGFEKGRDHFNYIMDYFSVSNREMIFVGDSLKDAEKAFENGIGFIGLCATFEEKDFHGLSSQIKTIKSIRELCL